MDSAALQPVMQVSVARSTCSMLRQGTLRWTSKSRIWARGASFFLIKKGGWPPSGMTASPVEAPDREILGGRKTSL